MITYYLVTPPIRVFINAFGNILMTIENQPPSKGQAFSKILASPQAINKYSNNSYLEHQRQAEKEFESVFIAEMLTHAGLDKAVTRDSGYSGQAFSRMLIDAYASQLAGKGLLKISDSIAQQFINNQPLGASDE